MVGITSFGCYIPAYRLSRDELTRAWKTRSTAEQKAVACYDEDTITMAVASGIDCLKGTEGQVVDGIYLGTTTSPYAEKLSSAVIAVAIDCPPQAGTVDITNSLRAGTTAINCALDAIKSGRMTSVLVIASDGRLGTPRGEFEGLLGDGAAALLFGDSGVIATVEDSYSITNEMLDVWRTDKDTYLRSWEDRFIITQGYNKIVEETVTVLMEKAGLAPKDFAKVILYAPDIRSHTNLAKKLGFDIKSQLQDSLISSIGHTGVASPLLMLIAALEKANPGDLILFASYGDGSDAFILKVTEEIENFRNDHGVEKYLQSKTIPINYEEYLQWRGQIDLQPLRRLEYMPPSAVALYRERKQILSLYGQKCRRCGTVQYPAPKICVNCQARDEFDDYKLSDKKAEVVTFAKDYATTIDYPPKIVCVIDFEGGGRMQAELTNHEPDEIQLGLPVDMTFRKLLDVRGIHLYFWKCKPIRKGE